MIERAVREGLRAGAVGSADARRLRAYWLYRMLFGTDPLRERLTLFWHGHFATSAAKVDVPVALLHVWQPGTLLLLTLAGGVIAVLGAIVPARAAARLTIAEVLRTE